MASLGLADSASWWLARAQAGGSQPLGLGTEESSKYASEVEERETLLEEEAAARRLEARGVKVDGDGEANEQESKAVAASSESLRRQKLGEHGEIMPAVRRTWLTLSAEAAILGEDSAAVELLNGVMRHALAHTRA